MLCCLGNHPGKEISSDEWQAFITFSTPYHFFGCLRDSRISASMDGKYLCSTCTMSLFREEMQVKFEDVELMILLSEYIKYVVFCISEWKEKKKKLKIFTLWKPDPKSKKTSSANCGDSGHVLLKHNQQKFFFIIKEKDGCKNHM